MTTTTGSTAPEESSDELPAGLGDDFGWLLARAVRAYLGAAADVTEDLPGGLRGHQLLRAVARGCPATQLALASALGFDRTVVTYLVDDLEKAGLVERLLDPADRRVRQVSATAAGRKRLAALDRRLAKVQEQVLAGLSTEEVDGLTAALRAIACTATRAAQPDDAC